MVAGARSPNVVLILADDLGYSDIGAYGGEIRTPNLDDLARRGTRFNQFYNTARCCPSRASLLTGLHPHQTGVAVLTADDRPVGYAGTLRPEATTIAEMLRASGYHTGMVGKWHLSAETARVDESWPTRRGFDYFYGTISGCGSYFAPPTLTRNETNIEAEAAEDPDYYYTDAISKEAVQFIDESSTATTPFFLYLGYSSPHWPLHARPDDVAAYRGDFEAGWDVLRQGRLARLQGEGVLPLGVMLSDRDPSQPPWVEVSDKEFQERRMEVYAAQVTAMDRGIGEVLEALDSNGMRDDTILMFLSDNGACAEDLPIINEESFRKNRDIYRERTRGGAAVRLGNSSDIVPGTEDTFASYGTAWANLSNAPFRFYKRWVHEGGIASPLIINWRRGGFQEGAIVADPYQLVDIVPTILSMTGVADPQGPSCARIAPQEGRSMVPSLTGSPAQQADLFWEHIGNAAIRRGQFKLVREYPGDWELYDLVDDRTEMHDLAELRPELVEVLGKSWNKWAERVGVVPWDRIVDVYRARGMSADEAAG